MENLKNNTISFLKQIEEIKLNYYKIIFIKFVEICNNYNCHFEINGGCSFYSNDNDDEIEDNDEMTSLKDFVFENEEILGLPEGLFKKGIFHGDYEKELNNLLKL
jgi:hypothetical protein